LTAVFTDNPSKNALLCITALEGGIYITTLLNTHLVKEKESGRVLIKQKHNNNNNNKG
jgi:hypothetical protein